MAATRIPAARAAVETLRDAGVGLVFGSAGATALPWYEALERADGIAHLTVRHEQGAAHMADGWARTTGRAGVVVAAPGRSDRPGCGVEGLLTGLRTARADAVPLVCVTGRSCWGSPGAPPHLRRASRAYRSRAPHPRREPPLHFPAAAPTPVLSRPGAAAGNTTNAPGSRPAHPPRAPPGNFSTKC
ncbi:thiamine pyrophosphate-binding protein [Streptomyces sp. NPDC059788]|uniref:thiamine pyrophosphate-binding protein n=1 Tax=Streptomyces sp. NPDC059788 TaxID=3346948 RepID=UPI0036608ADE